MIAGNVRGALRPETTGAGEREDGDEEAAHGSECNAARRYVSRLMSPLTIEVIRGDLVESRSPGLGRGRRPRRPLGRVRRRSRPRHLLALGGQAVPGPSPDRRRRRRSIRVGRRGAGPGDGLPFERAGAPGRRGPVPGEGRGDGSRSRVRPPSAALERGGPRGDPDRRPAHAQVEQLLRQAHRHVGPGPASRVASRGVSSARPPAPTTDDRRGVPVDLAGAGSDEARRGRVPGGVVRPAAPGHGASLRPIRRVDASPGRPGSGRRSPDIRSWWPGPDGSKPC